MSIIHPTHRGFPGDLVGSPTGSPHQACSLANLNQRHLRATSHPGAGLVPQRCRLCGAISSLRVYLLSTTIAGRRQAGVSGARQLEIPQIVVTLATLPQSIPYTRALRDATPLEGWTAPVLSLGSGWGREVGSLQQACNRLATCLQHACNYGDTPALLRCCPGAARGPRPRSSSRKAALLRRQSSASRGCTGKKRPVASRPIPWMASYAVMGTTLFGWSNELTAAAVAPVRTVARAIYEPSRREDLSARHHQWCGSCGFGRTGC